jgi:hypothetical protein
MSDNSIKGIYFIMLSDISVTVIYHTMCLTVSGADPGFQARGGALKKIALSENWDKTNHLSSSKQACYNTQRWIQGGGGTPGMRPPLKLEKI